MELMSHLSQQRESKGMKDKIQQSHHKLRDSRLWRCHKGDQLGSMDRPDEVTASNSNAALHVSSTVCLARGLRFPRS